MKNSLFTSESVTEGHPDKMCDQISDAVLDALIAQDPKSRVACETLTTTDLVVLAGEITSATEVDFEKIVRSTVEAIGYDDESLGFDYRTCEVIVRLGKQSPNIAEGVNEGSGEDKEQGAGDQGLMFGYACEETKVLMPMPIFLAHRLVERLSEARRSGDIDYLGPDGKSQVTMRYVDGKPVAADTVVISTLHAKGMDPARIKSDVIDKVIKHTINEIDPRLLTDDTKFLVNPTGVFEIGGPHGDCGLTGRKIIVDTYGGMGRHGGGAFSGKDPSKVDRSAAYMARYVAKNVVAAGLARECEVQLAYAIGISDPVSVKVDTFGSGKDEERIASAVSEVFRLKPAGIIAELDLLRPIFKKTAAYGHFGRELPEFTWEKVDKADDLRKAVS